MPTYSYTCGKCGHEFETFEWVRNHTGHYPCPLCPNGVGKQYPKKFNFRGQHESWPIKSMALGVEEGTQRERTEYYKRMYGINVEFDEDGDAILTSPEHRTEFSKVRARERKESAIHEDYLAQEAGEDLLEEDVDG